MGKDVFAVPVFFILFRETVETSIIVAVLLSFIQQLITDDLVLQKRLVRQVWAGTLAGLFICLVIGAGMISAFYRLRRNLWSGAEDLWEGLFSVVASIVITIMGFALLRVNKLRSKWIVKISAAMDNQTSTNYATKEGLEAVVFVGGVGLSEPATAFPLPTVVGLVAGGAVGLMLYHGGNKTALHGFLIGSTCVLYLVAAGLASKAAWSFDMYRFAKMVGGDVAETGAGPGSYNIYRSVWHVNCCSPKFNGGSGWGVFNSVLGWQNSATYGSVLTYNLYWILVVLWMGVMRYEETHGHYPWRKKPVVTQASSVSEGETTIEKQMEVGTAVADGR
ncbi:Similar to Plasma membrane iron permease; acc. no. Q09919 [Pyronema omphalodes CBS 100304]|uniref:Similar to Plasma membrane iron permease acc. no. Q09919 n=1 Tax=Pyronema omphalodes (strain CBS 100304) TaxID=1076935 RepID=U4LJX6_PYROM|nr:Similar to Plasma membrane iron permease; acc. no. Q09919 [Pyronema omphalodes CBS 100304]